MPDRPPGASREALWAAMEANGIAYFRGFACLPQMQFHQAPDLIWFLANSAPGNYIMGSRLDSQNLDARIQDVLAQLRPRVSRLHWVVLPVDRPSDLPQQLEAHGLRQHGGMPWMAADLTTLPADVPLPASFHIERVQDEQQLQTWLRASAAGFEITVEEAQPYYDAYACLGFAPDAAFQHYIGYLDETPVVTSTLLLADGLAGIYDVSTPPRHRGQGFGRAITLASMRQGQASGCRYASLQASAAGLSIYQKLGFVTQFIAQDYLWEQHGI